MPHYYEILPEVFLFRFEDPRLHLLQLADEARDGQPPNSMNKYGVVLDTPKLKPLMALYQNKYVLPIAIHEYGIKQLKKNPYAFLVEYEHTKQKSLARHYDSSDVTLNVCVEHQCTGGDLVFYGKKFKGTYKHQQAWGVIHRGELEHRAKPITSGFRSNLIFWCAKK